jgi:hypothetical protein
VFAEGGRVILSVTPADGRPVELDLERDDARGLCNMLGAAILHASRTGVRT